MTQPRATTGQIEYVATADGGRIRCLHAGAGRPVVLAHGYLLQLEVYAHVFRSLVEGGYRVIAFDQRGHGSSTVGTRGNGAAVAASDYCTVLEHFQVEDGTLVAHSMGAFLAIVFALRHPEAAKRLSQLVLLGANAGAVAQGSLQNKLQIPLLKSGLMKPLWRFEPTGRPLVRQLFGRSPDPRFVEETRNILLQQSIPASLPLLTAMCHDSYYERLSALQLQTEVVCGELDRTCPSWHSQKLGKLLPRARNHWLPDLGHMLMYEAPAVVVEAVRSHRSERTTLLHDSSRAVH